MPIATDELRPRLDPSRRRALIEEGIRLFNTGRYYDCHDAWETVWRSTTPEPRDLFQGLIQVGVGFFHFHERNRPDVARRVLAKGRRRLEPFGGRALGIDLASLLATVRLWETWLEEGAGEPPVAAKIVIVAATELS